MSIPVPDESALILRVPAAEPAVSRHRNRYDAAARVGVPAHVTIAYPFKPVDLLTGIDMATLTDVFARFQPLRVTFLATAWFGDDVLFLDPSDQEPLVALIRAVENAFPAYPIYGGAHQDIHPHLTVGQSVARKALVAAERDLRPFLPIEQVVTAVELWRGPALTTGLAPWAPVQSFGLGPPHGRPDE